MRGLKNKNVFITGASRGIGKAIAIKFAEQGANIAINYRDNLEAAKNTADLCKDFGVKTIIVKADMSVESEILKAIEETVQKLGSIDILINNAAIQNNTPSHERTTENFDKTIAVNLRGPFICSREVIKHFLSRNSQGVIINISSPHEIIPKPGFVDYAVSKAGMWNLTRTLALEYADRGIRVNSVVPGAVLTDMNKNWANDPEKRKSVEAHIPLKRAATPEEIAPTVVFIASDDASYITGASIFVDGGAQLYPEYRFNWSS